MGDGGGEGRGVCIGEVGSDRDPRRDAGNENAARLEETREIVCSGLALDVWRGGNDQFGNGMFLKAVFQFCDVEVLGTDAIERGEFPAEDVVETVKTCGFFDGEDLGNVLNNADDVMSSSRR